MCIYVSIYILALLNTSYVDLLPWQDYDRVHSMVLNEKKQSLTCIQTSGRRSLTCSKNWITIAN